MDFNDLSGLNLPEKEQKILESAIKVFSEKGYSASTTNEIAKNAGIAEGTIFRYFKTKKDILRGILIHTINILSDKLVMGSIYNILSNSNEKDLRAVLKEVMLDRIKLVDSVFPMARVVLTEALFHEDVREVLFQNIISKAMKVFSDFHKQMVEKGMMRSDLDPEAILRSVVGNIGVLIAQRKLFGDKFLIEDLDKELDKTIEIMMYGIARRD